MRDDKHYNWARNQACAPLERHAPSTVREVARIVERAASSGRTVKVVGSGHSFSDIACTDGVLLTLDALSAVESIDRERLRVTVQAGIRLHALNDALARLGLALPNLGDIAYQSIAGAISTATHGTGLGLGNLATTIVGMELVTGEGEVLVLDEGDELLRVARVGLGALGVITKVTIQCVPSFQLHARETIEPFHEVLERFGELAGENDHFELFWMPGTDKCLVKRNNRTSKSARPPSKSAYFFEKIVAENWGFGAACRVARRFPSAVPRLREVITAAMSERDVIDRSDRVFASPRHVRFYETEYGVPLERLPEAMNTIEALVAGLSSQPIFPIECRVSAADDIPLSTAYERASGWIACHVFEGMPFEEYFRGVKEIMAELEGRPHWGKMHFEDHESLAPRYPAWDRFQAARAKLDPRGTFENAYTARVLGPRFTTRQISELPGS